MDCFKSKPTYWMAPSSTSRNRCKKMHCVTWKVYCWLLLNNSCVKHPVHEKMETKLLVIFLLSFFFFLLFFFYFFFSPTSFFKWKVKKYASRYSLKQKLRYKWVIDCFIFFFFMSHLTENLPSIISIHRLRSRRPQGFSMHDDHQQMWQSAVLALLLHYPQAIFVHN